MLNVIDCRTRTLKSCDEDHNAIISRDLLQHNGFRDDRDPGPGRKVFETLHASGFAGSRKPMLSRAREFFSTWPGRLCGLGWVVIARANFELAR
jgi:hypothetical protein